MKFFRPHTIRAKIFFWFVLVAFVPLALSAYLTYRHNRENLENQIKNELLTTANQRASLLDSILFERMGNTVVTAQNPLLGEGLLKVEKAFASGGAESSAYAEAETAVKPFLTPIAEYFQYENLHLVSRDGTVVYSQTRRKLFGHNLFTEPQFNDNGLASFLRKVLTEKQAQSLGFHYYPTLDEFNAHTAAPVLLNGEVVGVVMMRMDINILKGLISHIPGFGKTGETVLGAKIGDDLVCISALRPDSLFKKRTPMRSRTNMPMQKAVLMENGEGLATDYRGIKVLAVWRYLPVMKLGLVVKIDEKEALAPAERIKWFFIVIAGTTFLLVFGLTIYASRSIADPIRRLSEVTEIIAGGNLDPKAVPSDETEVGRLAVSFNKMVAALSKLSQAVQHSPLSVVITDAKGKIEHVNPKGLQITGYTLEEAIGKTPRIFKSGKHSREFYKELWDTILSGQEWRGLLHNRKKNGELYWEATSISSVKDGEGRVTHFIGVKEDVTERIKMETELQAHRERLEDLVRQRTGELKSIHEQLLHSEKLASLGKLTASIAHEFNNPLYGVRNIVEQTFGEESLSDEIKDLLRLAIKECDRMADMIRKLQSFYKPSMGISVSTDIHQIIDDVLLLLKKDLHIRNIKLQRHYAPDLSMITAIEDQLKQVFLNILQNAADAISDGGTITIATEMHDGGVKVVIRDTGEGISEENIKKIFEPYFTTKAIKGTGLGLPVCYGIIKSHGGDIGVESKLGEGTVFTVTLPLKHVIKEEPPGDRE